MEDQSIQSSERAPLLPSKDLNSIPENGQLEIVQTADAVGGGLATNNDKLGELTTKTDLLYGAVEEEKITLDISQYSRGMQILLFVIMVLVNVLGPLSTEAQVPALQDIARDLNTTPRFAQLTITIYMLSFGASQLAFGTLSDMYGRRRTLIAGLIIYVVTNIGCALSPNIIALNIFRAFQAMGSGAGMVIVYAVARDVFTMNNRTRVLGFLGGSRPIIIASSPVFGGTVTSFLGWRYIFWIIGGLSMILLVLVVAFLPETRDINTVQIATPRDYIITVKKLVKKRIFVGLVLISGAVYAGVFIMFNEFSFVMENRYGFTEFVTGLLCGAIVFGLLIGSLISIGFVRMWNPITVVCIGIAQIFVCGCLLVVPVLLYSKTWPHLVGLDFWWTVVPLFFYICADGLMLPHLVSTALEPFKDCAGTASALAGFWRFFSAAAIALAVSAASDSHLPTLHLGTASMAILAGLIYVFTLFGVDASEFTAGRDREMATDGNRVGYQKLDAVDIGNITVEEEGDDTTEYDTIEE